MSALPVDLTELPAAVREQMHKILTRENEREMVQAIARQEAIARFYEENRPVAQEGLGAMTMALDPYWVNYFRMKLKYDPAEEGEVRKWLRKKYDWFRVKHTTSKIQVGYSGLGGKRVKTYG